MDLSRATALVSGANRGLGKRLTEQLVRRGARVYAGTRRPERVDASSGAIPLHLDVTDPESVASAATTAADVNLLINNAGTANSTSLLTDDLSAISDEFTTNFYGALSMVRAFAGPIERNGGGTILNVLSALSWLASPSLGTYSATKAASWSMTNSVRQELAPKHVRVSALHVSFMDTDMTRGSDAPKLDPAQVATIALDGIAADQYEIVADDRSRNIRAGLAGGVDALYPDLPG